MRIKIRYLRNAAALFIGFVMSFLLVEIGFRVYYAAADRNPIFYDHNDACLYHVLNELDSGEGVGWLKKTTMYHPTLGWVKRPNSTEIVSEGELQYKITINDRGARGSRGYTYERVAGKKRIVFIGDSFTFGDQVGDNETYPYYVERLLEDTEVINLGVSGYGTDQMYLLFLEEGMKYSPDMLIMGIFDGDHHRSAYYCNGYFKPLFKVEGADIALTHVPVPTPEEVRQRNGAFLFNSYLLDYLLAHFLNVEREYTRFNEGTKVTKTIIQKLSSLGDGEGIVFLPVFLPREVPQSNEARIILPHIYNFLDQRNISALYLHDSMHIFAGRHPDVRLWDGHFTKLGNALAAEVIAKSLVDRFNWTKRKDIWEIEVAFRAMAGVEANR